MKSDTRFTYFKGSFDNMALPELFAFPFYYTPHPIALVAATELQERIKNEIDWNHDFGLEAFDSDRALGKMFGVLVVKNALGELGYLSAYSGVIDGDGLDAVFAPSIYNCFFEEQLYVNEVHNLDQLSKEINELEADPALLKAKEILHSKTQEYNAIIIEEKKIIKTYSNKRKAKRKKLKLTLEEDAYQLLHEDHVQSSINDNFFCNAYAEYLNKKLSKFKSHFDEYNDKILALKNERSNKSRALQVLIFGEYNFLNSKGESKNVIDLFKGRIPDVPPAGAGDCAAPKLFQYAYQNDYKPIALAEFWWGKAPNSKVRKHKYFYPACRGKCEPILNFMLQGIDVSPNPLLTNPAVGKSLETIFEDEHLAIINKPAEFLSVPGKYITDSVQERMLKKYPEATGPLIVHRLDMSTSGLMVIAKSKFVHKTLQEAFTNRWIKKRYVALLDGVLDKDEGHIDLPLRLDIENRPYQMVCYEHGKHCRTRWEVIQRNERTTQVYFYPLTGRTHQLRVHAAHRHGLGMPIVGDDLYGLKKDRLHLHAESLTFEHPITKKLLEVEKAADF